MEEPRITIFDPKDENASDEFSKWMEENTGDFFINIKSPNDMMLHKAPCGHFVFNEVVNLAANKKICSPIRRELEIWAEAYGNERLKVCLTCKP